MNRRHTALPNASRRTVGYIRCSTDDQAREGVTIEQQEAKIRAYCIAMGWPEPEVISDPGHSAKSLRRPGMAILLEALRRGEVARVIVVRLDRLTRSVRDLGDLVEDCAKHDTALVSIVDTLDTSTATGRMVANMMATVAQWEREIVGERTAAALGHMRQSGKVYGRTPFGFRREGDCLVPCPIEQEHLAQVVSLHRAGKSFCHIAKVLTELGARGKRWHASSVAAVLRSRMASEALGAA